MTAAQVYLAWKQTQPEARGLILAIREPKPEKAKTTKTK